jgi:hypothetical protein
MRKARFRVMAGLAGATLCLFAVTSYAQNTDPATGAAAGTNPQAGAVTTPAPTDAAAQPTTDQTTTGTITTTATDATTTTTTRSFPGGTWGIIAVAVLVLLVLFALFRGKDRTVVRETYASSSTTAPPRTAGTAADDRMNLNSRAASGPGTSPGGMNDPNARR